MLNMTNHIRETYKDSAGLLRVISHPVRLAILEILEANNEMCVCHLEAILGYRQAYLSQHLMCLRENELVSDRREGRNVYYRMKEKGVIPIIKETKKCTSTKKIDFQAIDCNCPECESKISKQEKSDQHRGKKING
jgi:ArsR family transcriptional regulator